MAATAAVSPRGLPAPIAGVPVLLVTRVLVTALCLATPAPRGMVSPSVCVCVQRSVPELLGVSRTVVGLGFAGMLAVAVVLLEVFLPEDSDTMSSFSQKLWSPVLCGAVVGLLQVGGVLAPNTRVACAYIAP